MDKTKNDDNKDNKDNNEEYINYNDNDNNININNYTEDVCKSDNNVKTNNDDIQDIYINKNNYETNGNLYSRRSKDFYINYKKRKIEEENYKYMLGDRTNPYSNCWVNELLGKRYNETFDELGGLDDILKELKSIDKYFAPLLVD